MVFAKTGANNFTCYIFDAIRPTATPTVLSLANDCNVSGVADVIPFNGALLYAYSTFSNTIVMGYVTNAGAKGTSANGYPNPVTYAQHAQYCLTLYSSRYDRFNLAYAKAGEVRHRGVFADLSTDWIADAQLTTVSAVVRNITGFESGNLSHTYFDLDNVDKWKREVQDWHRPLTSPYTPAQGDGNLRSVSLAGKIFYTDDNGFVPVVYHSDSVQSTMFLLRNDGDISAKMLAQVSTGETAVTGHLCNITELADNKWVFPATYKSRDFLGTQISGLTEVILAFNDPTAGTSAQLGENTLISGGYLQAYDGVSIFESGFHLFPDNITAASNATGTLPNGTYTYQIVYEWVDNYNQQHRSAPSLPVSVTISSNNSVDLTIPYLYLTDRKSPRSPIIISVFRLKQGGTIYYKVPLSITYNVTTGKTLPASTGAFSVLINDNISDANLTDEELYTTGNVLESIAPPAAKFLTRFKNRMFVSGLERSDALWYSKEAQPDLAVEFSPFLYISVDDTGGPITALSTMDDKLLIFKANTIFVLMGDGPNAAGAQNQFNSPQAVTTDVGAVSNDSVVKVRDGVMFKSRKGIYLIDRSLQVSYVGADVEEYNDLNITSAIVIDNLNQARFTTAEGFCLVYDMFFKQWSVFTNIEAVHSLNWQNKFIFLKDNAEVLREQKGLYTDKGQPIETSYVLSLLQFGQIQGFQRIYKLNVLGEYRGDHGLKIELGYDYRDFYEERFINYPDGILFDGKWGDDTVWGEAGSAWGGVSDGVYQFQVRPRQQRCQAMKLRISDFFVTTGTAGFALSNVTAEVGIEPNAARIAKTKIIAP